MSSSILYQSARGDITLIDIPASIAAAQRRSDTLLSTAPLETPLEARGKESRADKAADSAQHAEYRALTSEALAQISFNVAGPWCRPRKLLTQYLGHGHGDVELPDPESELGSRLREWAAWSENKVDNAASQLQSLMASLRVTAEVGGTARAAAYKWTMLSRPAREAPNGEPLAQTMPVENETKEPLTCTLHNPKDVSLHLTVSQTPSQHAQAGQEYRFTIPPRSTLFLSDSTHSHVFRASLRDITNDYTLPRHFDLVLLDPPWPNRSAKRKGAYEQVGGMPRIKKLLLKMDIDGYLEHNALVGIWITNKESLRELVLGLGGLFDRWNVGLVEEWVWIKTTTKGEPMFDMDDRMRKPYEILLLGRAAPDSWTTMTHAPSVRKRVIAAVPDIHSRKPCLKELLEVYMALPSDYSALEVFSRHLVAGWTSWGNEVLKYNWDKYWTTS